ncbi:MAG: cyclic-di-AMP receptor [Clostridia bacterium]|nr:cyclic-di-AMP receptor [Clostridia bacterium]
MKMIFAIVNNDDSQDVMSALRKEQIPVTKLASTGGFLQKGNTTFISGVEDDKVEDVIGVIRDHSRRRTQLTPIDYSQFSPGIGSYPIKVHVGGATIFVVDVERFMKV